MLVFAANLLDGFGAVLTPENLLLAAAGVTLGTLVGVLPGIGPALTIALLLPITFNFADPVGAFILFARDLRGRHVRRVDDVDPAQHARRVVVGGDRDRGLRDGQARARARAALATAAIGSFVAGTIGIDRADAAGRAGRVARR